MSNKLRNRILPFLLAALVLFASDFSLPALSAESDEQTYNQYIGWYATLNVVEEENAFVVLDYEPDETYYDNSLVFFMDEFSEDVLFRITAFKIVNETYETFDENGDTVEITAQSLWYQVNVISGTASEYFADGYWILQNYLNAEDAYEYDVLTLTEPADEEDTPEYSAPSYIVSDGGVTVSGDKALFTELVATETEAPAAYYINRAVAYNMTPKTETGDYTGHADVTIPIPEGWDSEKLFGFVVEDDGTITAVLGTVTEFGTFRFTVPHFSEVGLLEATAVTDVLNKTIVFGKVNSGDTEYVFSIEGKQGETGRFVSGDGAVQYVINHYTSNDTTTTYVSLTGLDVTPGTEIIVGNTSIIVIVKALENEVHKLLTGGTANSVNLNPLYDVGISGDFDIEYTVTAGEDLLTLSGNTITAEDGATGQATVEAKIKHPTSGKTVGYVTYNVTVTNVEVTEVKNIYVPKDGTVTITSLNGDLSNAVNIDAKIATATYENGTLTITGMADSGETSVIVGNVLLTIYAEPASGATSQSYMWLIVDRNPNCTIYYSINGGTLHKLDSNSADGSTRVILIGLDMSTTQLFPDGFSLMLFGAPDEGYITSQITAGGSEGQFYSLSNGSRYDGSDSDAWPMDDPNAQTIDGGAKTDNFGKAHGLYGALSGEHMTVAKMRDLFTRALALGCDSVTLFSRNNNADLVTNVSFIAEELPTFKKTIVKITRVNGTIEEFTADNPYDPDTDAPLEIGDTVTYQFAITITSTNIKYWFDIIDTSVGYKYSTYTGEKTDDNSISAAGTHVYTTTYLIGKDDNGDVDVDKIKLYANGEFTNTASLSYTYKSGAASGQTETVSTSSVTCRISSIVTWMDSFGTVRSVQTIAQGTELPKVDNPTETGYTFDGWDYDAALAAGYITESGDGYEVTYGTASSFTINGEFTANEYTLQYAPDGGTLPEGVEASMTYTIEDLLTLPTPTKEGYTFDGWLATPAADSTGNWTENALYAGGYVLLHRYGDVTLTAQWTMKTYTVTWVDEDGTTVLETDENVTHGATPTYNGTMPTKVPANRYIFSWSPAIAPVTEDVTYTAQFKDILSYPIRIGINIGYHRPGSTYRIDSAVKNSYHALPDEPNKLTFFEALRVHIENDASSANYGKWVADENWNVDLGTAKDYIDPAMFSNAGYVQNGSTWGIYDGTGKLIKDYFSFETGQGDVYTEIIKAWLAANVQNTDINWSKVGVADCQIIPYVIKLQDDNVWYVDMVVVVKTTSLTINVPDIADSGVDQTFLFQITSPGHEGFGFTVAVPEGGSVTINGLFPGKTYNITELTGWSWRSGNSPGWEFTTDGDTDDSGTGSAATITLGVTGNQIEFTNTLSDPGWLGDEDRKDNDFALYTPVT